MVLSTQNPVDVDYKALSNAGTWAVGSPEPGRNPAYCSAAARAHSSW